MTSPDFRIYDTRGLTTQEIIESGGLVAVFDENTGARPSTMDLFLALQPGLPTLEASTGTSLAPGNYLLLVDFDITTTNDMASCSVSKTNAPPFSYPWSWFTNAGNVVSTGTMSTVITVADGGEYGFIFRADEPGITPTETFTTQNIRIRAYELNDE